MRVKKEVVVRYEDGMDIEEFSKALSKCVDVDMLINEGKRLSVIDKTYRDTIRKLDDAYNKDITIEDKKYEVSNRSSNLGYEFVGITFFNNDVTILFDRDGKFDSFKMDSNSRENLNSINTMKESFDSMVKDLSDTEQYIQHYKDIKVEYDIVNNKFTNVKDVIEEIEKRIITIEKVNKNKNLKKEREEVWDVANAFFQAGQEFICHKRFPVTKSRDTERIRVKNDANNNLYFEMDYRWTVKKLEWNKKNVHLVYTWLNNPVYDYENADDGRNYWKIEKNYKMKEEDKFSFISVSEKEYEKAKGESQW